jgi:hypothetical protein
LTPCPLEDRPDVIQVDIKRVVRGHLRIRRREWNPAVESSGIEKPARLYDLRSTFASNALAAGITVYDLTRIIGRSVGMIEAHYGALLDTAHESLLDRLGQSA